MSVETDRTTAVTDAVARHWHYILGATPTDPDQDFFRSGGTSVLAVRLTARLQGELGFPVALRLIFDESRFHAYAGLLSRQLS